MHTPAALMVVTIASTLGMPHTGPTTPTNVAMAGQAIRPDVYKRQRWKSRSRLRLKMRLLPSNGRELPCRPQRKFRISLPIWQFCWSITVSYTHLELKDFLLATEERVDPENIRVIARKQGR